jgi:hypothetical protein
MVGNEVKIIKKKAITLGSIGYVEKWHIDIHKFEVYFGNGFCGFYTRDELEVIE